MNILAITPYFPAFDIYRERAEDPRTKFLYDYAVEWVKAGHAVLVIHTVPKYPSFFPRFARLMESFPAGKRLQLNRFIQKRDTAYYSDYVDNGIHIIRIPVPKYIPHRDYLSPHVKKLARKAETALKSTGWRPDLILSDFLSPSLALACHFKRRFAVPVFQILHQSDLGYFRSNKPLMQKRLHHVAGFLFRSYSLRRMFTKIGCNVRHYEYMFSGIPAGTELGNIRRRVVKFLYVGTLRYSKNVHELIRAFAISSLDTVCVLEIVGSGPDEEALKQLAYELGIAGRVNFLGKVSREKVFERMRQSDCLVMVSRETFGMVYIEAMSQGCVVIAARGQGIDGIVVDGENGFLVPLNDTKALAEIMQKASRLKDEEVFRLSKNAIDAAARMKDDVLAHDLLEKLKAHTTAGRWE